MNCPICSRPANPAGNDAEDFERRIVHSFAGPVAQARHTGKLDWRGGSRDFENAWKMAHLRHAEKANLREVAAFLSYCWVRAHELVWLPSRWAAIESLARVLVDAQRLTESEATRLMMEAAQPLMLADSSAQTEDHQAALDNRSLQLLMRSRLRPLLR